MTTALTNDFPGKYKGEVLIEELEKQLDSFDLSERKTAMNSLLQKVQDGEITFPGSGDWSNLHYHTFFSYNSCGYSPAKIAWLARKAGLAVAGIVDFDVFDGLEEFYEASALLGLKASVGMETRVFVPEFADKVINSPGEPGIAYHMGTGFPGSELREPQVRFSRKLRKTVEERNLAIIERVNKYLSPVELDYEKDVCPLTPSGNATERHICLAYARKAHSIFSNDKYLEKFWGDKLQADAGSLGLPEGIGLLNLIRAKTMKRGGVGYVQPGAGSFPTMADTNRFILDAGGIPTLTWLDGTSQGEQDIERLLDIAIAAGVSVINIIPDRNYTPNLGENDQKCRNLYAIVDLAQRLDLPVIAGTEMNSPGQKFVDDFASRELRPLVEVFLKGANIVYAHSVLQRRCGLGYTSKWANKNFKTRSSKNEFFQTFGGMLKPSHGKLLDDLDENITLWKILDRINDKNL